MAAGLLQDHRAGRAASGVYLLSSTRKRPATPVAGRKGRRRGIPPVGYPKAASWASAALRPREAPGFSTGRSKGFQISPTTFS